MAEQQDFPVLFTVEGTNRHEVLLVQPSDTLDKLKESMQSLLASSPNLAEFMGKYRNKELKDVVKDVTVRWASEGRDKQLFPRETVLTKENCAPVLRMMAVGVGKDVFDVKLMPAKAEGGK
ncbi:uncharacterized protein LTR77_004939 [Saxophila tyrrhenica]|uniref:Uncharacterized protein n=1 Tax=Saxophila tyrrhenica TaxID=1690608 RepID=A0AAV9PAK8_9PEZI|nr:hypothetical protein LTR77_004939 [Saxophila tyrrhenica]